MLLSLSISLIIGMMMTDQTIVSAFSTSSVVILPPKQPSIIKQQRRRSVNLFFNQLHSIQRWEDSSSIARLSAKEDSDYFIDGMLGGDSYYDSSDPLCQCTHMIGIPLEYNHDLMLELESIQRAILYHCPLLINSIISPTLTRMPLLYINTEKRKVDGDDYDYRKSDAEAFKRVLERRGDKDSLLTSRDPITQTLHSIVIEAVQDMINVQNDFSNEDSEEREKRLRDEGRNGVNKDNIRPLMIKFEGLEIDGESNEALHAIGTKGEGTTLLRNVVGKIKMKIEDKGWEVFLPPDNPQMSMEDLDENNNVWRPRVPFIRLPPDFTETLPNPKGLDGGWENYSVEDKKNYIRFPEEGGNGISPIFWFKWWEDSFCDDKGVRMQEVAVYGRTAPFGMTEKAFYVPHLRVKLPVGNALLQKDEEKGKDYDSKRTIEKERMVEEEERRIQNGQDIYSNEGPNSQSLEEDLRKKKSGADRRMLQTIFDSSPDFEIGIGEVDESQESNNEAEPQKETKESVLDSTSVEEARDTEVVQDEIGGKDTMLEKKNTNVDNIIRGIEKPIVTGDWSKLPKRKNKPRFEDNPIIQNFRKNGLTPPKQDKNKEKNLPPFPSDEYFVGIWRFISTQGGPNIDEQQLAQSIIDADPSLCENLILRVDGLTAGGPILDVENQQRSAGGTWKFYEAEWVGSAEDEEGNISSKKKLVATRLRIRLVVPPKKETVLVFEGEVRRGVFPSTSSMETRPLTSFEKQTVQTIPMGEVDLSGQDFLQCSGEVWSESLSKKANRNRSKVGKFTMIKMKDRDPNEYIYTIPAPKRYQD